MLPIARVAPDDRYVVVKTRSLEGVLPIIQPKFGSNDVQQAAMA